MEHLNAQLLAMGHGTMPMTPSRKQTESRSRTPTRDLDHAAQPTGPSPHAQHSRKRFAFLTRRAARKETCSDKQSSRSSTTNSAKFNTSRPLLNSDMGSLQMLPEAKTGDSASLLNLPLPKQQQVVKKHANESSLSKRALDGFFDYLSLEDLLTCRRVCKSWSQAITVSREWKERLYLAPAPSVHDQPAAKLNPLLTTISSKVSQLHQIYDNLMHATMTRLLQEDHNLVFSWNGRYYRPQTFFNRSSNPALSSASSSNNTISPCVEWQLRALSRYEICSLKNSTVFPGPESSLWKMYLCQPPPIETHITIWEMDKAYEDDTRLPQEPPTAGHVTERFVLQAWSIREIFERMDEARNEDRKAQKAGGPGGSNTSKRKLEKFRHLFVNDSSSSSSHRSLSLLSPSSISFHNTSRQHHLPPQTTPSSSSSPSSPSPPVRSANPIFDAMRSDTSSYSKLSSISSFSSSTSQARKKAQQVAAEQCFDHDGGVGRIRRAWSL
ncbi:hypothetical protein BST61_g3753 [Cercospora zeina]